MSENAVARVTKQLAQVTEKVGEGVQVDVSGLEQQARQAASMLRSTAARAHDRVGVRIVRNANGIRVTLTGPAAGKYRALMAQELAMRMPQETTELRTQITRRIK